MTYSLLLSSHSLSRKDIERSTVQIVVHILYEQQLYKCMPIILRTFFFEYIYFKTKHRFVFLTFFPPIEFTVYVIQQQCIAGILMHLYVTDMVKPTAAAAYMVYSLFRCTAPGINRLHIPRSASIKL